jgi:four helix bundle protein
MSGFKEFEEIEAWQRARELSSKIYEITSEEPFASDYSLSDQIRRAANSIVLNIAEGFGRGTNKEFRQFVIQARGSAKEVKAALYLAGDQQYLSEGDVSKLQTDVDEISKMLSGLIQHLSDE